MSDNYEYILPPWEAENQIEKLEITQLDGLGTAEWFEYHKKLMQLNQQSILEISQMRDETIKEFFINFRKVPVLIYEAIQIEVWKIHVFPLLIELNGDPSNTFMIYSTFYHELIAVSLIENILFHSDGIASLDDTALDLIDYAVANISPIIFGTETEIVDTSKSCLNELLKKKQEIQFDIAMKCISILGYFATGLDILPLSVVRQLLTAHDLPYLFTQLIENPPWKKFNSNGDTMIYSSTWKKIDAIEAEKIFAMEGQVWIALRELLLNPKSAPYYEITEFRVTELTKLQKHLHERVLDQIAPLIDLRRWLSYLTISSQPSNKSPMPSVEIVFQVRSNIVEKYHNKWRKLAKLQSQTLFSKDIHHIKAIAQVLNAAYDLDKLTLDVKKKCTMCAETASKRCSQCKSVWYCRRECQVNDWTNHKAVCKEKMKETGDISHE